MNIMLIILAFAKFYLWKFHEIADDSHRQNIILIVAVAKSNRRNWR